MLPWRDAFGAFVAGGSGIWFVLANDRYLYELDPTTGDIHRWSTGAWTMPAANGPTNVLPAGKTIWVCGVFDHEIREFDVTSKRIEWRFNPGSESCPVAATPTRLWLLDRQNALVTEVDVLTRTRLGRWSIAPAGSVREVGVSAYAFHSLWFPLGETVYRFDTETQESTAIAMPSGVTASAIVADQSSGTVWVADCAPQFCDWIA